MRRLVLVAALLSGSATAAAGSDVARSWDKAEAFVLYRTPDYREVVIDGPLEARFIRRILEAIDPVELRGVILHLHGCAFSSGELNVRSQARAMAALGFVVLLPNSLARGDRLPSCDPETRAALENASREAIHRLRQEEIAFALARLRALDWVPADRILLAGFGEGADAVLDFAAGAVRGRIALAPPCRFDIEERSGTPTLIIRTRRGEGESEADGAATAARCRAAIAHRPDVEYVEVDGAIANPLIYEAARVALWNFLVRATVAF
jgi:dienelactone hydrolase